ncbi:hypothetical protein MTO96_014800 [Rhipicephalus appendiculatus]
MASGDSSSSYFGDSAKDAKARAQGTVAPSRGGPRCDFRTVNGRADPFLGALGRSYARSSRRIHPSGAVVVFSGPATFSGNSGPNQECRE